MKRAEVISVVSLASSIIGVAIVIVNAKFAYFDVNIYSLLISILSFIVMLLLGFHIVNYLTFERRVRRDLKKDIEYNMINARNASVFASLGQLGVALFNRNDYAGALQAFMNALCVWEKSLNDDLSLEAYNTITQRIKYIASILERQGKIVEFEEEVIGNFRKAALKTQDNDIIEFVMKFKIKKDKLQKARNVRDSIVAGHQAQGNHNKINGDIFINQ